MADRLVIYHNRYGWAGAIEVTVGCWPSRTVKHAPIFYANTAEEVFAWLLNHYPDRVIALDPEVSKRYSPKPRSYFDDDAEGEQEYRDQL